MYDYQHEPRKIIFMIDSKSFYASVESVERGLNPLKSVLVVMSTVDNTGDGLVLASSPMAKKLYGITNVTRGSELPKNDKRLLKVPPRMNLYIKKNLEIKKIFESYVANEDLLPYSIDESLLDITKSWKLFGSTPYEVARRIQLEVKEKMGIYLTIGIGDNPLLAKLALDIEAKHNHSLIGEWHYEDVPDKLWPVEQLSSVWSIGKKTAQKLKKLGINTIYDLAYTNPYFIKEELGVMGSQLFALSWGVDRSIISEKYVPKSKSFGNSQVLPKNYSNKEEIETVLKELAEQVGARLRSNSVACTVVSIGIGFAYKLRQQGSKGFGHSMKIDATNSNQELRKYIVKLFEDKWHGEPIRHISFSCGNLVDDNIEQLDLFDTENVKHKNKEIDKTVDEIRKKYGFKSIVKLDSKSKGATAINRTGLIGGHAGGNAYE